jgi:hypothetical protein
MAAIKAGFENSSGAFVAMLDADDMWLPKFLDQHIAAHLNGSFSAALTASDTLQINENDELLETTFHTHAKYRTAYPGYPLQPVLPEAEAKVLDGEITVGQPSIPPLFYVDQEHRDYSVVAMSSLMFRRAILELIIPADTEQARICADYYLIVFAHAIGGTLTIWSQLSCFRMHRTNNFSNNGVLGGRHSPGHFPGHMRWKLENEIARHVIANFPSLSHAIGAEKCRKLIRRIIPRRHLYKAVKDYPSVAALFGRSPLFFKIKYGTIYPLLKKH